MNLARIECVQGVVCGCGLSVAVVHWDIVSRWI